MDRYLKAALLKDLSKKIVIITGPRQVGKTTLSKALLRDFDYYNYDNPQDRKRIHQSDVDFSYRPLILDELHKMRQWKRWLKGHFDTRTAIHPILVTGSARIDTYKKVGDSLAGRYYQFRLLPLDVKELVEVSHAEPQKALESIFQLSGFPEPLLSNDVREYRRWRSSHLDIILRQDLLESGSIKSIRSIELLVELMAERVGSLISYNSLREDLGTDDKTVKRWFDELENSYVFFRVTPYSKKINRAVSKAPKYYFFDIPRVVNEGARFENLVALSIYKEILYRKDVLGEDYSLHFLRNKNQNEVDFLICHEKRPLMMVEVKLSDKNLENSFHIFEKGLGVISKIILVKNLDRNFTLKTGIQVLQASRWLEKMDF
ncbi:MAG: ATP-binding protein [Bdellovibrionales bacterium]|nr:ATP-binding protein [Bdellovibrionales bacterium]